MIDEEKMTLTIPNENGVQTEYEILFSFVSGQTQKHYLVFTDGKEDETGSLKIYTSTIDEKTETLNPVETDEELKLIEEKFEEYKRELENSNK